MLDEAPYQMSLCLGDLGVDELAWHCRRESDNYRAGRPNDDSYALELFRRAIRHHDQAAWRAVYAQYSSLVAAWVRTHSRFHHTGEEVTYFVNETFTRFWHTTARHYTKLEFKGLGDLLAYLKACVHSAIEDECRRQTHRSLIVLSWDELSEVTTDDRASPEQYALGRITAEDLARMVFSRLQDQEELVVAIFSWSYGLRPREIQARRPDLFPKVEHVYQVKRNILNRLRRDRKIQTFLS